jgi:hypothetical protein
MSNRSAVWLVVALLTFLPGPIHASDSQAERATLVGLGAISVVVEDLTAAAEKNGLRAGDLQRLLEQRLRQGGITVTPDADAYLYEQVIVADSGGSQPWAYVVTVSLMQEVALPRDVRTRTPLQCPTWWLNTLGLVSPQALSQAVQQRTGEFADQFVKAYREVNPR